MVLGREEGGLARERWLTGNRGISRLDAHSARLQCAGVTLWLIGGFSLILLCDLGLMLISGPAVLVSVHKLPLSGLLLGCLRLTNKSRESNSAELRRTRLLHDERLGFIGAVMLVLWMMLWLVVMSQPLGKSGLRRLKLHLRMLTRFAGGPVAECGVELGRGSCQVSFCSTWRSQLAQCQSDVC